jgi:hypothetical protein
MTMEIIRAFFGIGAAAEAAGYFGKPTVGAAPQPVDDPDPGDVTTVDPANPDDTPIHIPAVDVPDPVNVPEPPAAVVPPSDPIVTKSRPKRVRKSGVRGSSTARRDDLQTA